MTTSGRRNDVDRCAREGIQAIERQRGRTIEQLEVISNYGVVAKTHVVGSLKNQAENRKLANRAALGMYVYVMLYSQQGQGDLRSTPEVRVLISTFLTRRRYMIA